MKYAKGAVHALGHFSRCHLAGVVEVLTSSSVGCFCITRKKMPVFRSGWPLVAKGYGFYFGSMLMFSGVGDVASFWIGTCPTSQYFDTYEPCCPIGVLTIYLDIVHVYIST